MLNRWVDNKRKQESGSVFAKRRPGLSTSCTNLQEAEHWRRTILKEISKGVSDIMNGIKYN